MTDLGNGEIKQARDDSGSLPVGSSGCDPRLRDCPPSPAAASGAAAPRPHNARMTTNDTPVLTIDGPSGSGKGTISRLVARRLGWHYLDSGALYRAIGVAAGWGDIDLADPAALVRCTFDTEIGFRDEGEELRVLVNGQDATDELRTETAGAAAS